MKYQIVDTLGSYCETVTREYMVSRYGRPEVEIMENVCLTRGVTGSIVPDWNLPIVLLVSAE